MVSDRAARHDIDANVTSDPRESMRRLGRWLQPLLTEWTGKALHDEPRAVRWTPLRRLAVNLAVLAASTLASSLIIHRPALWLLLPVTWMLTAGAMRAMQTSFVHHASHGGLSPHPWLNRTVGELMSTLALVKPLSLYKADHLLHHARPATSKDSNIVFLAEIGVRPGLTMEAYRRWMRRTIWSPRFHFIYLRARFEANFIKAPPVRRAAAIAYIAALLGVSAWQRAWVELVIAWLVPLLLLFHVSALYQLITEHTWVAEGGAHRGGARLATAPLTSARFVGEAAPPAGLPPIRSFLAWSRWIGRMIFIHGPARLFVLTGDLPQHDFHHVNARADWSNAAYARRDAIAQGSRLGPAPAELWGLAAAVDATFAALSALPPSAQLGDGATYEEQADTLLAI